MAPPRKHTTDHILDAARTLVLADGPRAASVAAIAELSGAPVGTLYHRFGSRDAVLAAAWLRALEQFQSGALAAVAEHPDDPLEAGVAVAVAALGFARRRPEDARLLLVLRRSDLLDAAPDDELRARIDAMNAPLEDAFRRIARSLGGRADARTVDAVTRAVVDLPGAAIRRHLREDGSRLPEWLAKD
jgi:AcrR family transcriptional regulator